MAKIKIQLEPLNPCLPAPVPTEGGAGRLESLNPFLFLEFRHDLLKVIQNLWVAQSIPVQNRSSVDDIGHSTLHLFHIHGIGGIRHLHDDRRDMTGRGLFLQRLFDTYPSIRLSTGHPVQVSRRG